MNLHEAYLEFTYAEMFVHVVNRIWHSKQQKVFQELLFEDGFGELKECFMKLSKIIYVVKLFEEIMVAAMQKKINRLKSC